MTLRRSLVRRRDVGSRDVQPTRLRGRRCSSAKPMRVSDRHRQERLRHGEQRKRVNSAPPEDYHDEAASYKPDTLFGALLSLNHLAWERENPSELAQVPGSDLLTLPIGAAMKEQIAEPRSTTPTS